MEQKYPKPPIVEAVIDLRSKTPLSTASLDKVKKKLENVYPFVEAQVKFGVMFSVDQIALNHSPSGHKLTSTDALRIAILSPEGVASSKLSPYLGWDDLSEQASNVHSALLAVEKNFSVSRVGIRYINRIDIPAGEVDLSNWLTVGLAVPSKLTQSIDNFGMQFVYHPTSTIQSTVTLYSQPSPLINYSSIALDIDVSSDTDFLLKGGELKNLLPQMRECKNLIFENCITDAVRDKFA
jgi:uncharacterized protein (TIGR04255 family)